MVFSFEDIENIWSKMKEHPTKTISIVAIITILVLVSFYLQGFLGERGRQAGNTTPPKLKPIPQKSIKDTPTPLLDIELTRVKSSPPFEHLKPDFAYDMILHNKSDVAIYGIVVFRNILANKNRQKLAITGTSARDIKPFTIKLPGVLGAGESKAFHREHSPSFGYMELVITYRDDIDTWYRCDFEGDRNGIFLKGCKPTRSLSENSPFTKSKPLKI